MEHYKRDFTIKDQKFTPEDIADFQKAFEERAEQVEEKPEIIENPYFGDGEDAQTFDIIQFKQPDRDYLAVNQDREWVDHIDFDPAKDGKDTTAVGLFVCINGEWKLLGMVSKASFDCDIATLKSKLWRDNG